MGKIQSWEFSDSFWEKVEPITHHMHWMEAGFFVALWRSGLAEYD